jgi:hypothetical protein
LKYFSHKTPIEKKKNVRVNFENAAPTKVPFWAGAQLAYTLSLPWNRDEHIHSITRRGQVVDETFV